MSPRVRADACSDPRGLHISPAAVNDLCRIAAHSLHRPPPGFYSSNQTALPAGPSDETPQRSASDSTTRSPRPLSASTGSTRRRGGRVLRSCTSTRTRPAERLTTTSMSEQTWTMALVTSSSVQIRTESTRSSANAHSRRTDRTKRRAADALVGWELSDVLASSEATTGKTLYAVGYRRFPMAVVHALAFVAGALVAVGVLSSAVRTMIVPRSVPSVLARF